MRMSECKHEPDSPRWTPRPASVAAALGAGFWMFMLRGDLLNPAAEGFPLTYRLRPAWPDSSPVDRFYLGAFLIDASLALGMMACAYVSAQILAERLLGRWMLTVASACVPIAVLAFVLVSAYFRNVAMIVVLIPSVLFTLASPFLFVILLPIELDKREQRLRARRAEGSRGGGGRS